MEFYLIRHAKTVDNQTKRYSGRTDCEISQEGYAQLVGLSRRMSEYKVQVTYTSPAQRAVTTAESFFNDPIRLDGLREIDFGSFEGLTLEQIKIMQPLEYDKMMAGTKDYVYPQGEGMSSFFERICQQWKHIVDRSKGYDRIAIVAHSGSIRAILSNLLAGDDRLYWNFRIDNASVTRVTWQDNFAIINSLNEI